MSAKALDNYSVTAEGHQVVQRRVVRLETLVPGERALWTLPRDLGQTRLVLIVHGLDIRIVHANTGELIRHLTLDPTRDYQPTGRPKGPTR
jgi:hypothetical protein